MASYVTAMFANMAFRCENNILTKKFPKSAVNFILFTDGETSFLCCFAS